MTRIINLNKIICTLKKFGDNDNKITKTGLFAEVIKKAQIGEGMCHRILYEKHVKICQKLDLLKEEDDNFVLTDFGQDFYDSIPPKGNNQKIINEKSEEIKQKLTEKIFEKTEFIKNELGESFVDIQIKHGEANFLINKNEANKISKNVLELLKDLELMSYQGGQYQVSSKIGHKIPKTRTNPTSEEELYNILKIQREIGKAAEERTIKFEKKRLRNLRVKEQVLDRINRKSKTDTGAGYDIDSFEGETVGMSFDRFIEVKATTGNYPVFYWSENERAKAKEYGDKYFIYIWINFGKPEERLIEPIQNPYRQIVEENYEKVREIITWRVTWDERS